MTDLKDSLLVGGVELGCRLFTGTGKYGDDALIPGIVAASGCEVVTVALRRVDLGNPGDNILSHIPAGVRLTATPRPAPRKPWRRKALPSCPTSTPISMSPAIWSMREPPPSCRWARPSAATGA